jgi:predicted RNA-binding Zn-ribbon protein involved in translation (DUF1610 family)
MDPAYFKIDDIQTRDCLECGEELEFWKDDVKLTCPKCGQVNFNPNIGNTCLSWCRKADECVGNTDIHEWLERQKKKDCN